MPDGWERKEEKVERVGDWDRLNTRGGKLQGYRVGATKVLVLRLIYSCNM